MNWGGISSYPLTCLAVHIMSKKRPLADGDSEGSSSDPFLTLRDKELFEIDRNILARIVYKNQFQYKRIDVLDRVKSLVKLVDEFLITKDLRMIPTLIESIELAAERFFQQLSMGLMITFSMTCVGALGRLAEIVRRIPSGSHVRPIHSPNDEGVPVDR